MAVHYTITAPRTPAPLKVFLFLFFQLNEITSWIDGNLMYGTTKAWADALRSFKDGLLAATNDSDPKNNYFPAVNKIRLPMANPPPPRDHYLKNVNRFFSKYKRGKDCLYDICNT